jgi:hypothetical protein
VSPDTIKPDGVGEEPKTVEEISAQADPAKVAQAKETLRYLDKVVKTLSLFGKGHVNPERAREEFTVKLNGFLKSYGDLALDLDGSRVLCDGALVLEDQQQKDDFAFRLFQDGVNQIRISAGVSKEELNSLFTILLANFSSGQYAHDDSVTLLWELRPEHVNFAVSEGYDETGGDPENAPASTDEYRQVRMALTERRIEPGDPAAPVSLEEEQRRISKFQALISKEGGLYFSPQDRARLLEEAKRGQQRLVEKYIEILYRLAASGPEEEHLKKILAIIGQLFLGLVSGSGLDQAARLLKLIKSFAQSAGGKPEQEKVVNLVLGEVSNRDTVIRLLRSLAPKNRGETIELERAKEVFDFLALLGDSTIEYILDYMGEVVDPSVRSQVCGMAAVLGRKQTGMFAEKLTGAKGNLTGDLLEILKAIGTSEAAEAMLQAAFHPEPEIRLKVVTYADKLVPKEKMKPLLLKHLKDNNERVRGAALKRLEDAKGDDVVERLKEIILDNDFSYRGKEEKRRIFHVLGSVGGQQMLPFFRECFNQSNPLRRSRVDEARGLAAYMLGVLGDIESRKDLEKRVGGKLASAFLKWSCAQAIGMLDGTIAKSRSSRSSMPPALASDFRIDSADRPSAESIPSAPEPQPEPKPEPQSEFQPELPPPPKLDLQPELPPLPKLDLQPELPPPPKLDLQPEPTPAKQPGQAPDEPSADSKSDLDALLADFITKGERS